MREWLRGGAPPCQGGGRGFESRLALFLIAESFAGSRLSASVIAETFGNSTAVNSKNEFHLPQKSVSTLRILRKTVQI